MLEAQESVSSATVVPTVAQLTALREDIYRRLMLTDAPGAEFEKVGNVITAWDDASGKAMTLDARVQWARKLQEQSTYVAGLEGRYPRKKSNFQVTPGPGRTTLPTEDITGTVPWWYWPLRVGAGIGTGLLIYRTLRPKHGVLPSDR